MKKMHVPFSYDMSYAIHLTYGKSELYELLCQRGFCQDIGETSFWKGVKGTEKEGKIEEEDMCHQWSTQPEPQSLQ